MKDWIKKQFKMTPTKRFMYAYLIGFAAAMVAMLFIQDYHGKEAYIALVEEHWVEMHWAWWLIPLFGLNILYVYNSRAFNKETLWMTIKNPAKIAIEQDDFNRASMRPIKPPPPPKPPKASGSKAGSSI